MGSSNPTPVTTTRPEFYTSELYFAAYLQTEGIQLMRTERESTGRVQFVFINDEEVSRLRTKWFAREAITDASKFTDNIRNLKNLVHSGPRQ